MMLCPTLCSAPKLGDAPKLNDDEIFDRDLEAMKMERSLLSGDVTGPCVIALLPRAVAGLPFPTTPEVPNVTNLANTRMLIRLLSASRSWTAFAKAIFEYADQILDLVPVQRTKVVFEKKVPPTNFDVPKVLEVLLDAVLGLRVPLVSEGDPLLPFAPEDRYLDVIAPALLEWQYRRLLTGACCGSKSAVDGLLKQRAAAIDAPKTMKWALLPTMSQQSDGYDTVDVLVDDDDDDDLEQDFDSDNAAELWRTVLGTQTAFLRYADQVIQYHKKDAPRGTSPDNFTLPPPMDDGFSGPSSAFWPTSPALSPPPTLSSPGIVSPNLNDDRLADICKLLSGHVATTASESKTVARVVSPMLSPEQQEPTKDDSLSMLIGLLSDDDKKSQGGYPRRAAAVAAAQAIKGLAEVKKPSRAPGRTVVSTFERRMQEGTIARMGTLKRPKESQTSGFTPLNARFPSNLREILRTPKFASIIAWDAETSSIVMYDRQRFEREVMPLYFSNPHGAATYSIKSFQRQLCYYGFFRTLTKAYVYTNRDPSIRTLDDFDHLQRYTRSHRALPQQTISVVVNNQFIPPPPSSSSDESSIDSKPHNATVVTRAAAKKKRRAPKTEDNLSPKRSCPTPPVPTSPVFTTTQEEATISSPTLLRTGTPPLESPTNFLGVFSPSLDTVAFDQGGLLDTFQE